MKKSFKITVKNGVNLISFKLTDAIGGLIGTEEVQILSDAIISELANLYDANTRIKELGYKGNFFKFTTGRKCILAVEVTTEEGNLTLVKNLEFSFGKIANLEFRDEILYRILATNIRANDNDLLIEKY